MKSILPSASRVLLVLVAVGMVSSCGSSSSRNKSSEVASSSGRWFKVQEDPPTFFPKGVPADHPTGFSDGMWVDTGDPEGTRYFIPAAGSNTKELIDEALAAMTPERREEVKRMGKKVDVKGAAGKVVQSGAKGLGHLFWFMKDKEEQAPESETDD